ncbi:hypothetical protein HCN44_007725 [Aphidius gifuensis]|uniref:Phosphatidic acid phosphatase type 2/haloperoxidase domain-containing protein n=1 Tax=Aphidius gifuensis TaxID=684658 RepID=A0A835CQI0_APHGI|nr:phospholipid phosphatase 6 [Aphidius gifuensis]KAF7989195.1 hypothetical protein HCN44_007725 [Aphidius gifuensis]
MKMKTERREIPSLLKKVLTTDVHLTDAFVNQTERFLPLRQIKIYYKFLEVSGHGLLWLSGWLAFIWIANNKNLYQMQVNLLIGLLFDILTVAILKAVTRRRRPSDNKNSFELGPDKFSFPSGHASRASLITFFFFSIHPVSSVFILTFFSWTISICLSRILLRKHYFLDIICGISLGIMEGFFINMIYLKRATCVEFVSWITDEKLDGGEFHV